MSMNNCYSGVIHYILSYERFLTGRKNLDGPVVIIIIGKIVFLKFPFFNQATSVYFGITLP